ncbi:MAG: three-Cys-motif partner protein TcmP [Methylocystis sp.]
MARKHYDWKIGQPLPEIGKHSLAKHAVFGRYVDRYIRILSSHPAKRELNLTIIDGFCGGGKYTCDGKVIDGSPLVLLNSVRATEAGMAIERQNGFVVKSHFYFVDKQKQHIDFLMAELNGSAFKAEIGKTIQLRASQFEKEAPSIIEAIKRKGPSHRALFFLDQYGWSDVSFASIRGIFTDLKNPEVILTFSVDSLIDYFRMEVPNTRGGRAAEITNEFAECLAAIKTEQGARYVIQNFLYKHVTTKTGAEFYTPFFIRSADNHRSYWLLHLSKHERARDEMARLHWEMTNTFVHHGDAGFNALGYNPNVDPDQGRLEFDFGSDARVDSLNAAIEQLPRFIRDDASGQGAPVTIGELFKARCNETPLTMPLVVEAVVKLRDDLREVEILTPEGKVRPSAVNLDWRDQVRPRAERTFFRLLGAPAAKNRS